MTSQSESRKCFVVGPIGADDSATRIHADWVLDGIILPIFVEHYPDFIVYRSDRMSEPGMIDAQMINHLIDDDLVIADMSELNPNAFYEIGLRHMAQKPIIHIFVKGTKIPFDVSSYRAIPFCLERYQDIEIAKASLKKAIDGALLNHTVENPVTRARGTLKIQQSASPETQVLLGRLDYLETKISSLEDRPRALEDQPSVHEYESSISCEPRPALRNTPNATILKTLESALGVFLYRRIRLVHNTYRIDFARKLTASEVRQISDKLVGCGMLDVVYIETL